MSTQFLERKDADFGKKTAEITLDPSNGQRVLHAGKNCILAMQENLEKMLDTGNSNIMKGRDG